MKLTIIRLLTLSEQDRIDLAKIWPESHIAETYLSENARLYAARFNDRLLAAVRVELLDTEGRLTALNVREITRRRGVGQYLVEEVLRDNPSINEWMMSSIGVANPEVMDAFAQALGFQRQGAHWHKSG